MMPPRHPFDYAQPFEIHPLRCDCPSCDEVANAPSLVGSLIVSTVLASGGIGSGLFIGWALQASGFLALIGVG